VTGFLAMLEDERHNTSRPRSQRENPAGPGGSVFTARGTARKMSTASSG
jgi:hypothetical protein